jgi:hypothetical protein
LGEFLKELVMDKIGLEKIKDGSNNQIVIFMHGFNFNDSDKKKFLENYKNALERVRFKGAVYELTWKSGSRINPLIRSALYLLTLLKRNPKTLIPAYIFSYIINKCVLNHFDFKKADHRAKNYYPPKLFDYIAKNLGNQLEKKKVFLIGHSLGTVLIFEALEYFLRTGKKINFMIEDVFFLGSAINSKKRELVQGHLDFIQGRLFNFYSKKDMVLKYLRWKDDPYGLSPIEFPSEKIVNIENVNGHTQYLKKDNLKNLLRKKNVKRVTSLEFY